MYRISLLVALLWAAIASAGCPDPGGIPVNTDIQLGWTFSPDGNTVFWTGWNGRWGSGQTSLKTIYTSHWNGHEWSEPQVAKFSHTYNDGDPFVSPDGRWVYFVSDRPRQGAGAETRTNTDIWRYPLDGSTAAQRLSVNSMADEYSPVLTASGTLYFASAREGGLGEGDIYRAVPRADGFAAPELLSSAINSPTGEWNLWVSEEETEMLFEASSRKTNLSTPGDLYYSRNSTAGWSPAIPVTQLNTRGSDLMPRLAPDGTSLYYSSAEPGGKTELRRIDWRRLRRELQTAQ
jgi:Tol biopolymer transport system component